MEIKGIDVCINRNIVECKERKRGNSLNYDNCINRNIVECKVQH